MLCSDVVESRRFGGLCYLNFRYETLVFYHYGLRNQNTN